jgi:uncharacterized protein (TIGR03067 family)
MDRTAVLFIARRAHWSFEGCFTMHPTRISRFVVVFLATGLCAPGLADDDAVKNELKRHQGSWIATSSTFDGQKASEEIVGSIKRIVTGDHVVWQRDGKQFAGTKILLDSSMEPNTIDVIPDGGPNRGERIVGICKLDRDTLTICMAAAGQPRPTEFKAEKGSGWTLQMFTREKPASLPRSEPTKLPA